MKYLKSFNESIETISKSIVNDIDDICLELNDMGYSITHTLGNGFVTPNYFNILQISSNKADLDTGQDHRWRFGNSHVNYEEISEVVERIKDFMSQNGYETKVERIRIADHAGKTDCANNLFNFVKLKFNKI